MAGKPDTIKPEHRSSNPGSISFSSPQALSLLSLLQLHQMSAWHFHLFRLHPRLTAGQPRTSAHSYPVLSPITSFLLPLVSWWWLGRKAKSKNSSKDRKLQVPSNSHTSLRRWLDFGPYFYFREHDSLITFFSVLRQLILSSEAESLSWGTPEGILLVFPLP